MSSSGEQHAAAGSAPAALMWLSLSRLRDTSYQTGQLLGIRFNISGISSAGRELLQGLTADSANIRTSGEAQGFCERGSEERIC